MTGAHYLAVCSVIVSRGIWDRRFTAESAFVLHNVNTTFGNLGSPEAPGFKTVRLPGRPTVVRNVTPKPAPVAAQRPARLGLVNAKRHEIPALSSASIPAEPNTHGGSNPTNGNGSPPNALMPAQSGRPIQTIGRSTSRSTSTPSLFPPQATPKSRSPYPLSSITYTF